MCVDGYVGTYQSPAHHWKLDASDVETHYFRALWVPSLVVEAKRYNVAATANWYVDGQGPACLGNDIALSFDLAVKGYADPQRYPKDSDECSSAGASGDEGGSTSPSTPDGGELSAVPIALDELGEGGGGV